MQTTTIIKGLDKKELLKWEMDLKSIRNELNWKLIQTESALYLHQSALQECTEKLQTNQKRASETRMALEFLSEGHPLRAKCEDDLYRTEIKIFRLENRLKRFSSLKQIQLEIKKMTISAEIKYYEDILKSITDLLYPPLVLPNILQNPDGQTVRKPLSVEELNEMMADFAGFYISQTDRGIDFRKKSQATMPTVTEILSECLVPN